LHQEELNEVREVEKQKTLLELVNEWLERMPYFEDDHYWKNYHPLSNSTVDLNIFWNDYRMLYDKSLAVEEKNNLQQFDLFFLSKTNIPERNLSVKANRSALFIMLYRDYPLMQLPFQLMHTLLDIDELMAMWRYRHLNMVHRMIGSRIGTGGSTGKDYLRGAMDKHYIYKEFADLTSFLIERRNLPELSDELKQVLGYNLR
jgi:tryptophan 2,3-dioxygenase